MYNLLRIMGGKYRLKWTCASNLHVALDINQLAKKKKKEDINHMSKQAETDK